MSANEATNRVQRLLRVGPMSASPIVGILRFCGHKFVITSTRHPAFRDAAAGSWAQSASANRPQFDPVKGVVTKATASCSRASA